jgi:hypothetical protein
MSQPRHLLTLQRLDTELDQARGRLAEIEALLNKDEALRAAQATAETANQARDEAQKELKKADIEVNDQQAKIARNQQITYSGSVTNPKELEDLQSEAAALSRHLETLEERQLEKMITFEEVNTAAETAGENLQSIKNQLATQHSRLHAEQANLQERAVVLESQRPELLTPLEVDNLNLYDKLRKNRAGLAVVQFSGNTCPACGDTLTSAQAQDARSANSLTQCSACQRILTA